MKKIIIYGVLLLSGLSVNPAQASVDVFIIDSFITPEKPHKFILSFFTTEKVTSELVIANQYNFKISDDLNEDHKIEIDLSDLRFDSTNVKYYITGENKEGELYKSDIFEVTLPFTNQLVSDKNNSLLSVCCLGGVILGIPSPSLVFMEEQNHIALSKEIPLLSFYSTGYNYPAGYISLEYTYIFEAERKNYLRAGYKHFITLNSIEYISGGITGFTDFEGFNGLAPEINIGLFKLYNVFTLYTRYRFSFQPSHSDRNFHEISIGLYSNIFSLNL